MKPILTLSFAFIVSFLLTGLVYMSDPDVNGMQDLYSLGAIIFIFILSFVPFVFIVIILMVSSAFGIKVGVITLLLLACVISYFLMTISHSSLSLLHKLEIMSKSSSFIAGAFALGALPHWLIMIRKSELNEG